VAKIDSVYDFTDKALVELKSWLEPWFLTRNGRGTETATGGTLASRILAEPSLRGYWPMDDSSGDAHDMSSFNQPLVPIGSPAYSQPGALSGSPQTSILLQGADQPAGTAVPTHDMFQDSYRPNLALNGGDATVMYLVYPTAYPLTNCGITQYGDPYSAGGSSLTGHFTQFRSDGQIYWSVGATQVAQSVVSVPLAAWTHVACTRSSSALSIYLNGSLVATQTTEAVAIGTPDHFKVGCSITGTGGINYYNGRIAHVALFSDDLPAATIAAMAASGVVVDDAHVAVRTVTATYAITAADEIILANGTFTVTLPTAVGVVGKRYTVKNTGVGTITVARTSSQNIDGAASNLSLSTSKRAVVLVSDNAGWQIVGDYL
jgi:hypothetical protein